MNDARHTATAALLLRLSLGTMFVAHALLKYFVFTLPEPRSSSNRSACRASSATRRSPPSSSAACC